MEVVGVVVVVLSVNGRIMGRYVGGYVDEVDDKLTIWQTPLHISIYNSAIALCLPSVKTEFSRFCEVPH